MFTETEASALLNALMFRDNHGNAYSDDCAQNRVIRKVAAKYGIEIREKETEGRSSEESRSLFGEKAMK